MEVKEYVEIDGNKYVKAEDGKFEVGDYVRIDNLKDGLAEANEGSFYEVEEVDKDGDVVIYDNVGELMYLINSEFTLFKPEVKKQENQFEVGKLYYLYKIPAATCGFRKSQIVKVTGFKEKGFIEISNMETSDGGDIIGYVVKDEYHYLKPVEKGNIVEISFPEYKERPVFGFGSAKENDKVEILSIDKDEIQVKHPDAVYSFEPNELILVAKKDEEEGDQNPKLEVGGYAMVIQKINPHTGKIVRIRDINENSIFPVMTEFLNGEEGDIYDYEHLQPLTKEEALEEDRWDKIGRKPGEFKEGDLVRFNPREGLTHGLIKYPSIITEVKRAEVGTVLEKPSFVKNNVGTLTPKKDIELICPVENRFDRS